MGQTNHLTVSKVETHHNEWVSKRVNKCTHRNRGNVDGKHGCTSEEMYESRVCPVTLVVQEGLAMTTAE
jgi:hypothetical protein